MWYVLITKQNYIYDVTNMQCYITFVKIVRYHQLQNILKHVHLGFKKCILMFVDGQNMTKTCNIHYSIQ